MDKKEFIDYSNFISKKIRIMLISSAYNSLTQSIEQHLKITGYYDIRFELYSNITTTENLINSVVNYNPDIIFCPFLKKIIPAKIHTEFICLIIHPGILGDRGPNSLDWVILNRINTWGVTIIQATEIIDHGNIWTSKAFDVDLNLTKSGIYNKQVLKISVELVLNCLEKFFLYKLKMFFPKILDYNDPEIIGNLHKTLQQKSLERIINWKEDNTEIILRKIKAADTQPGVFAKIIFNGNETNKFLYGCHKEIYLIPSNDKQLGEIFFKRHEAVCIKTIDGAVWIEQLRNPRNKEKSFSFKLPALINLQNSSFNNYSNLDINNELKKEETLNKNLIELNSYDYFAIPESPINLLTNFNKENTFQEISLEEIGNSKEIAILYFDFYNGAMTKYQCRRLKEAISEISQNDRVKILIMAGSKSNWSNGINLNVCEFAENQKKETWENLLAINELIKEILLIKNKIIISALQANAGSGGVYFALAADYVFAENYIVLNPHYKKMGLFGSEFHLILGKRRIGYRKLLEIKDKAEPMIIEEAIKIGIIDDLEIESNKLLEKLKKNEYQIEHKKFDYLKSYFSFDKERSFFENVKNFSLNLFIDEISFKIIIEEKTKKFQELLEGKSLADHEEIELKEMRLDIFNDRNSYSQKRKNFVLKL